MAPPGGADTEDIVIMEDLSISTKNKRHDVVMDRLTEIDYVFDSGKNYIGSFSEEVDFSRFLSLFFAEFSK